MASALHLLISASVLLVFLCVVYLIWYPGPLNRLHSTFDVIKLVIAVDLVLGPLLTFIVFDLKKSSRELARDVSVIVLVQVVALGWGMHITFKMRPAYVVFYGGTMYSVARDDIKTFAPDDQSELPGPWQKPDYVFVPSMSSEDAIQHFADMLTQGVPDVMYQTDRYLPFAEHADEILGKAMDIESYMATRDSPSQMDDFLTRHGGKQDDYVFYPFKYGSYRSVVGILKDTLSVVGLLGPVVSGNQADKK